MHAGKVIQGYRLQQKLSVRALAAQMGVEHTKLWRFEQGREIEGGALLRIVDWFLYGAQHKPKKV